MSVLPSGVAARCEITLECASRRATGLGAPPPGFSGNSHSTICPRLFPAATRRDEPRNVTAVTQSGSHCRFHACVDLVKSGMLNIQADFTTKTPRSHKGPQRRQEDI